jgi:CspA family cold shock protein
MATGTVKHFSVEEGCGVISPDGGDEDLFVRSASIARGTLTEGARVEFEVNEGQRGLEAFGVAPIGAPAHAD